MTVEAGDPSKLRIEWDEVPEIDEWIAAGHPVFTDPDSVQAQLAAAIAQQLQLAAQAQLEPAPAPRVPPPADRPTARIIAATPMSAGTEDLGTTKGELLLSVAPPGRRRYGARWSGYIRASKLLAEWSDIEVDVDVERPERVKIRWDSVPDGIAVVTDRLRQANERLAARIADGPQLGIGRWAGPAPATPPADPLVALERLAALRDAGALTDAEFAAEKARVLGPT